MSQSEDIGHLCTNGSCKNIAEWVARGKAYNGTPVLLYACQSCIELDYGCLTAPEAFGTRWRKIPFKKMDIKDISKMKVAYGAPFPDDDKVII